MLFFPFFSLVLRVVAILRPASLVLHVSQRYAGFEAAAFPS